MTVTETLQTDINTARDTFVSSFAQELRTLSQSVHTDSEDVLVDLVTGNMKGKKVTDLMPSLLTEFTALDTNTLTNYLTRDDFWDGLGDGITAMGFKKILEKQYGEKWKLLFKKLKEARKLFVSAKTQHDLDVLKTKLWLQTGEVSTYLWEEWDDKISDDDGVENTDNYHESLPYARFAPALEWFDSFEQKAKILYDEITWEKPSFDVFLPAYLGFLNLQKEGKIKKTTLLTVVDYNQSRQSNRWYTIDLSAKKIVYNLKVGHGVNSGETYPTNFGNESGSYKTSLWFYVTPDNITKAHTKEWQWLWLSGLDKWYNDKSSDRGIYVHKWGVKSSQWCFTLPEKSQEAMEYIKWWSVIFAYSSQWDYLQKSRFLSKIPQDMTA